MRCRKRVLKITPVVLACDCKESLNVCAVWYINVAGRLQGVHWQRVSESDTGELQSVPVEPEIGLGGQYVHVCVAGSLVVGSRQGGEVGRDFRGAGSRTG